MPFLGDPGKIPIDTYGKLENQNFKFQRVYFHAFVCELDATS